MPFDISYLLFLQNLRNALGGSLDEVFNGISKFAVVIMPLLPYLIFWAADKRWGYRFISALWCGEIVNGILKLTVCAYRPWIRSDAIEPAGDSKVAATGYSFPSGHTMCATATYGSVIAWQHKKRRGLSILCGVLIALTMLSRNFLGVHTPQDVVVGFTETVILIFLLGKLFNWVDGDEKRLNIVWIGGIILVIATLFYITLKPYPMDYVDGKLLVYPQVMMNDTFKACGGFLGLIIGSYLERKYVHYEIPTGHPALPVLAAMGLGIAFAWNEYFADATIVLALGKHWGNLIAKALLVIFVTVLYPMFIKKAIRNADRIDAEKA